VGVRARRAPWRVRLGDSRPAHRLLAAGQHRELHHGEELLLAPGLVVRVRFAECACGWLGLRLGDLLAERAWPARGEPARGLAPAWVDELVWVPPRTLWPLA
jgi:hypothetical protein